MSFLTKIFLIIFLVLLQVNFLPLNLAFTTVVGFNLFAEKMSFLGWLFFLAFLFYILGAVNLGAILLALSLTFIILQIIREFIPNNSLAKTFLLIISLPLSEVVINFVFNYLK